MSNLEKDVPLAELRRKYLRKYPLDRPNSSSERTPGYDSYFTRAKRSPIRLACDIVIFTSLILFFLIITISFATPYEIISGDRTTFGTYGTLSFLGKISYETEKIFSNLKNGMYSYAPEQASAQIISSLVLLISTITIVISSLAHFITAIVRFSKRQSLELMHTVMNYYAKMCVTIMIFSAFGGLQLSTYYAGYKISGATSFGLVMLGLILIGCSIALFISNIKNPKISKKLWISNIVAAVFGLLCVAILGTSRLGNATVLFAELINSSIQDFLVVGLILIFVAFFVVFNATNNIVKTSFLHMLTLGDEREIPKIQDNSPMSSAITMLVSSFIMLALTMFSLTAKEFSYDIVAQGIFVTLFSVVILIVSIVFRKPVARISNGYLENIERESAEEIKPTPKPVPKPIPKPMPKPVVKADQQPSAEVQANNTPKPVPKAVPKPIPKPVQNQASNTVSNAPKQKVVIKITKPKQ